MQRPLRTSELHEEPRMRQSRPSQTPAKAKAYSTRLSRIPTRPSSVDRGHSLLPNGSAARARSTPQKTPLRKTEATRVLFTAEKQRMGNVLPHNDKKWVQEQTQRITEYLREAGIAGIGPEFFTRNNGLRFMSIKQFVTIINHFLDFIWGKRHTVSTSQHADDIIKYLQKLNYPHQLKKSWLKTPNAQHSFGNVILLLDFLMDFLPPNAEEEAQFELLDPDEFQTRMLLESEMGFQLWDKGLMEKYNELQRQTCNAWIYKCSGLKGIDALEAELAQLRPMLDELEKQRPPLPKDDEKRCRHLKQQLKHIQQAIQRLQDEFDTEANKLQQLLMAQQACKGEIAQLKDKIQKEQVAIRKQICSVAQRDKLIEEVEQLKHMLLSENRTITDLTERSHHQSILLSRVHKKVTDQVEKFNAHMRDISNELQLPLNVSQQDIQHVTTKLQEWRNQKDAQMLQKQQELEKYEVRAMQIKREIEVNIEPKHDALHVKLNNAQICMQQFELQVKEARESYNIRLQQLDAQIQQLQSEIAACQQLVAQMKADLQRSKAENEETMSKAEQHFEVQATGHETYLNKCEGDLELASGAMAELVEIINLNDIEMSKLKQQLKLQ